MPDLKKFELTPAVSILLAGVLIAAAIIFTNTRTAAAPVAAADIPAPAANANVHAPSASDHVRGSLSAPIVLIEYSDFQCPFCSLVDPTIKRIVSESNGQIAWVYRHLPLESIHPQARPAALASECVFEQLGDNGFWAFGDKLFANQKLMNSAYYAQVAGELGADVQKFNACVASEKYASKIDANAQEAMQNGGQGTPYTILFSKKEQVGVSGALPYETFSAVIKAFRDRQ